MSHFHELMNLIDEVSEIIPVGVYIKICEVIKKAYEEPLFTHFEFEPVIFAGEPPLLPEEYEGIPLSELGGGPAHWTYGLPPELAMSGQE